MPAFRNYANSWELPLTEDAGCYLDLFVDMRDAARKETHQCHAYLSNTAEAAVGIAAGVIVAPVLAHRQMRRSSC